MSLRFNVASNAFDYSPDPITEPIPKEEGNKDTAITNTEDPPSSATLAASISSNGRLSQTFLANTPFAPLFKPHEDEYNWRRRIQENAVALFPNIAQRHQPDMRADGTPTEPTDTFDVLVTFLPEDCTSKGPSKFRAFITYVDKEKRQHSGTDSLTSASPSSSDEYYGDEIAVAQVTTQFRESTKVVVLMELHLLTTRAMNSGVWFKRDKERAGRLRNEYLRSDLTWLGMDLESA